MQLMPKQDMTGSKVFVEVSFAICLRAKQLSQANVYPATLLQLARRGGYIDTRNSCFTAFHRSAQIQ